MARTSSQTVRSASTCPLSQEVSTLSLLRHEQDAADPVVGLDPVEADPPQPIHHPSPATPIAISAQPI